MALFRARRPIISTPPVVQAAAPDNPVQPKPFINYCEAAVCFGLGLGAVISSHPLSEPVVVAQTLTRKSAVISSEAPPQCQGVVLKSTTLPPAPVAGPPAAPSVTARSEPPPPYPGCVVQGVRIPGAPAGVTPAVGHLVSAEPQPRFPGQAISPQILFSPPYTGGTAKPVIARAESPRPYPGSVIAKSRSADGALPPPTFTPFDIPGIEFSAPSDRLHWAVSKDTRLHYAVPSDRSQFETQES